jgi:hypothetical protein
LSENGPLELARRFHAAINARDQAALAAMLSEDHRFVDSAGGVVSGKSAVLEAWQAFFAMFLDYRNHVEVDRAFDCEVAMRGESRCSDPRLEGPALWRAKTLDGLVTEWQVCPDSPENRALLNLD